MATPNDTLITYGNMDVDTLLPSLGSRRTGLTSKEVVTQRQQHGRNDIASEHVTTLWERVFDTFKNPLNLLLVILAIIAHATGDYRAAIIITGMMLLAVVLRFTQEIRADAAAAKLKALVANRASVVRDGHDVMLSFEDLVVGDIVNLSAGDMIPADVRIIAAKNVSIDQSTLTGEALPASKFATATSDAQAPLEHDTLCFLGSNVVSGAGQAVVVATGAQTF
ncbi:MAG: cation-transporting P-type ATPase, partial [Roseiflexaceae bacterium]